MYRPQGLSWPPHPSRRLCFSLFTSSIPPQQVRGRGKNPAPSSRDSQMRATPGEGHQTSTAGLRLLRDERQQNTIPQDRSGKQCPVHGESRLEPGPPAAGETGCLTQPTVCSGVSRALPAYMRHCSCTNYKNTGGRELPGGGGGRELRLKEQRAILLRTLVVFSSFYRFSCSFAKNRFFL